MYVIINITVNLIYKRKLSDKIFVNQSKFKTPAPNPRAISSTNMSILNVIDDFSTIFYTHDCVTLNNYVGKNIKLLIIIPRCAVFHSRVTKLLRMTKQILLRFE